MNAKTTILYERLSHEDGRENESLSIENQKSYLEEYATRNGFTNFVHRTDDGWSGTRWDRPGFMKMMDEVERGGVGTILIVSGRFQGTTINSNCGRTVVHSPA